MSTGRRPGWPHDDQIAGANHPKDAAGDLLDGIWGRWLAFESCHILAQTKTHGLQDGQLPLDLYGPLEKSALRLEAVRSEHGVVDEI